MKSHIHHPLLLTAKPHRGVALITSVMLLVVITLLALSMFKSFGIQERLAGNTLEKQRSFQAAESVLQYGEWWLAQGYGSSTGVSCTAQVDASSSIANMRVCDTVLTDPASTTTSWPAAVTLYQPSAMTVQANGGIASSGDVNYAVKPALHIAYRGLGPNSVMLFEVTGFSTGGTNSSTSVVQSTYAIRSAIKNLGGE